MIPTTDTPQPPQKQKWWQRILFSYKWMSRRNKIAFWGLLIAIAIATISIQWLKPAYRGARMWYFIHLAEEFVEKKDYGAASLAYRKVILSGYERADSWRSLGKFLEKVDSPEQMNVWERLASMEPNVKEHRYKQIAAAIRFGRAYEAEQILNRLPEAWRNDPEYLRSIADIAIQKNQLPIAERTIGQLLVLNPQDERARYDLLLARSKSPDPAVRAESVRELGEIGNSSSPFAAEALRKLIDTAAAEKNFVEADRLATKLIALPAATVNDRLAHLQFELMTNSLTASVSMVNLRKYAQENPVAFDQILQWFIVNKIDEEGTAKWIEEFPPEVMADSQINAGLLQYYLSTSDFDKVFRNLRGRSENLNIPKSTIDLAQTAIASVDNNYASSDRAWMEAVYASERNPQALYYLSLIASSRGWTSATGRALSALADATPNQAGVWNLLAKHESAAGNLPGYHKALSGLMRINPYDIHVASDWVISSVLLRKGDTPEILDVAKRTYDATEPADPWAGTAYAMALISDNRPQAAYEVMMRMSEANRMLPQRAIYVGAVMTAAGRKEEALQYFERAESFQQNNFAEEKMLMRIWKGVAKGEATTAEEQEKIIASRRNLEKEAAAVEADLLAQVKKRADPAEVRRILETLKIESESRKVMPQEVQQLIQEIRGDRAKRAQNSQQTIPSTQQ